MLDATKFQQLVHPNGSLFIKLPTLLFINAIGASILIAYKMIFAR